MSVQTTDTVLMISPDTFGYNTQTAVSNVFQKKPEMSLKELRKKVSAEFKMMVKKLSDAGINVIQAGIDSEDDLPDAVFPNNWFATYEDGTVMLFPMLTENRRKERSGELIQELADSSDLKINKMIDLSEYEKQGLILEGTGSLVLDRKNNAAFAIRSDRTIDEIFEKYCSMMKVPLTYRFLFSGYEAEGSQIYHTNVMMSIGEGFAVVCDECISRSDRDAVIDGLKSLGHEVIRISLSQMNNFCGNILHLKNINDENIIVMSRNAKNNFEASQLATLEKYGRIADVNIDTIESVGGGSARCMMAEIFLPKA
jgi:hypothetical protein